MQPNDHKTNLIFTAMAPEDKSDFKEYLEHTRGNNNKEEYKEGIANIVPENSSKVSRTKKSSLIIKTLAFLIIIAARVAFTSYSVNGIENSINNSEVDPFVNKTTTFAGDSRKNEENKHRGNDFFYTNFNKPSNSELWNGYFGNIESIDRSGFSARGILREAEGAKAMFSFAAFSGINHHFLHLNSSGITYVNGNSITIFSVPAFKSTGRVSNFRFKSFSVPIYTIGIRKNGIMIEEYHFWDNMISVNQLGLSK
jgi:hypothetical protein